MSTVDRNTTPPAGNEPPELHRTLREWNDTAVAYPTAPLAHELVRDRAREHPDAVAVRHGDRELGYGELVASAERLSAGLRRLGIGPEERVGIFVPSSPELVVGWLGVLLAGGAFVAVDPGYPAERIDFILGDAGVSVLLTVSGLAASLPDFSGPVRHLDRLDDLEPADGGAEAVELGPSSLAYVIYTSGSTGRPKGVAVAHGSLLNLVHWHLRGPYGVTAEDRWVQLSSPAFDGAVWEIWPTLAAGGSLHVPPPEARISAPELIRFLAEEEITLAFVPTALTEAMLDEEWPEGVALRTLMTGGEALTRRPDPGHPFELVNNYGPTETTCIVCCQPVASRDRAADDDDPPAIGRPLGNVRFHVVDDDGRPVAPGVPGELLIGGACLGRGYLDRPARTAERFVPDPFVPELSVPELSGPDLSGADAGGRLYRTGDRVSWRSDGSVQFLGRIDRQVKLRGFRIELEEVEAALARHPGVREAAAVVREDVPDHRRLVAYVAAGAAGAAPSAEALRAELSERLPAFMVPGAYVVLPELPKNAHGKVDRHALPAPSTDGEAEAGFVAPRTPFERRIAEIWSALLGVGPVGAEDDFFMLGGSSLLVTRMLSRVREEFDVAVAVGDFLPAPTLAELAAEVERAGGSAPPATATAEEAEARRKAVSRPIPRQPMRPSYPLSPAQRGVWLSLELDPDNPSYNLQQVLELTGPLSRERLQEALQSWIDRWDVVRATFTTEDGEPVQRFGFQTVELPFEDLRSLGEEEQAEEVERRLTELRAAPYDLRTGPLHRFHLFRLGAERHVLSLGLHHIVADGVSLELIAKEVMTLYAGGPLSLPKLQYQDFIAWQREQLDSGTFEPSRRYWLDRLSGEPPELELPMDRPRPARPSYDGGVWTLPIDRGLADGLRGVARKRGTTLFSTVFAAFESFLSWLTRTGDVVVGVPFSGRSHPDLEDQVGFFVTAPPLRTDLAGDLPFTEVLARFDRAVHGALEHQDYPFDELLEELDVERDLSRSPVYTLLLNARPPVLEESFGEVAVRRRTRPGNVAQYELQVMLQEDGDHLDLAFIYRAELFDRTTIGRWAASFEQLARELVAHPDARPSELPRLRPAERHLLLFESNDTAADYPRDRRLHELVAAQVAETPDAVAVIYDGLHLSYRRLAAMAAAVARELASASGGFAPETPVGVYLERSPEMVVALLAVLEAGGAYLPLDPEYPPQRIAAMVEDSAVPVILTAERLRERIPASDARALCLDHLHLAAFGEAADAAEAPSTPRPAAEQLAYVIYTSGSTGRPKGSMNSHGAIVNRLLWMQDAYRLDGSDRVLQKTPFSFDVSVWELFWPLLTGAGLVVAEPGGHRDAAYLGGVIARERVTTLHFVPSMLQIFVEQGGLPELRSLRRVIASGEALPADLERRFFARSGSQLHNLYGPTEAAVDVTAWACRRSSERSTVPIGRPIGNLRVHVLDRTLGPAPIGAPGELYLAGAGLGRGYLARPALTAGTFLPDPLGEAPGERLYRSGDLARRAADGTVEFLGRVDHQVKVRGLRIELGEIEALLAEHPEVRETAVTARGAGDGTATRLVAYVAAPSSVGGERLAAHLGKRLPHYMVPSSFVFLERLPLTPNGKLDRRALPEPEASTDADAYVPPRSPVEETLARIWAEMLDRERVGIRERFFSLGGHSLQAIRVMWRIRELLDVELPVSVLFDNPTVESLAAKVKAALERTDAEKTDAAPSLAIERLPADRRSEPLPLSFAQQRLWFLHQLEPESAAYNFPLALRLEGRLRRQTLERAVREIVRRHELLRSRFSVRDGQPVQEVDPEVELRLEVTELEADTAEEREDEARRLLEAEAQRPFDLERSPLRALLIRLEEERHVLLLCLHHAVADGWSIDVLRRELAKLYDAFLADAPSPLAELPVQYADYAWWERERFDRGELDGQLDYWRRQLDGVPVLHLPTDRPRPLSLSYHAGFHTLELSLEKTEKLRSFAAKSGVTFYVAVLAAFQALLHRLSGQDDVAVGSPTANRNRSEVEGLVGCFVNTLVLRSDLGGSPDFRELVARVKEVALGAYAHQEVPFDKLVEELQPERDLARNPFFQVVLAQQTTPAPRTDLTDLELRPMTVFPPWVRFDLEWHLWELPEGLRFRICYSTDLFDAATIARFAGHFDHLVDGLVADPGRPVAEHHLLSPAERDELLHAWRTPAPEGTEPGCVHELFEEWARQTPDAVAVIAENAAAGRELAPGSAGNAPAVFLSYRELDRRATLLARFLRASGVRPEAPVGIAVERSAEMLIAALGVLEAGAAYLPLDPVNPPSRLVAMMEDATGGAGEPGAVLLTVDALADDLAGEGWRVVRLDGEWSQIVEIAEAADADGGVDTDLDQLAYVIYTSGSTGVPKGVQAHHRGLWNLVAWHRQAYGVNPRDRSTVLAAPGFDASVWEVWPYLASGATLLVPPPELVLSPRELSRWLADRRVTSSFLPTPVAETFLAETSGLATAPTCLRAILTGGDRLHRRPVDGAACRLVNHYGPTESTVVSTCAEVSLETAGEPLPSIGRPIAGLRCRVLDDRLGIAPPGVAGELCVGGEGLVRGYLHRPALTAEKFVPDPFAEEPGARLYRTGDVARGDADGALDFLGRADQQVKIRGFRIELPEIEALLVERESVSEAVVVMGEGPSGEARLWAYVVPVDFGARSASALGRELRDALERRLPSYMVPSAFVPLEQMPLTANGKVDRDALPRPETEAGERGDVVPPGNEIERRLTEVFQEVLGIESVGVSQNYFELGASSLMLVRVRERLEEALGREVQIVDLFRYPNVQALAEHLGGGAEPATPAGPVTAGGPASGRRSGFSVDGRWSKIAVIGMAGNLPGAPNVRKFWQNLCDGVESIRFFTREELVEEGARPELFDEPNFVPASGRVDDPGLFDAAFFGFSPRDAESLDPQHRLFMESAWEALESAGYDPRRSGAEIGIFAGCSMNNYVHGFFRQKQSMGVEFSVGLANTPDSLATRVSYKLDLRGPAVNFQNACSTSLVAAHHACLSLLAGECRMAIVGASSIRGFHSGYHYEPGGIFAPDGHCRAFDENAQGTIDGIGSGAVVLKLLDHAVEDGDHVHAVIRGSGINNDGSQKVGFTAPSVEGQVVALQRAYQAAGVHPGTVQYVEAHGTGTGLGDPIEIAALKRVYSEVEAEGICAVTSSKPNIGHLDTAAGMPGLIKTALALENRTIPPSINVERPNPKLGLEGSPFYVNTQLRPWPEVEGPRRAATSSFGMGGTNVHMVLEEAPPIEPSSASRPWQLLPLSARTPSALEALGERFVSYFEEQPPAAPLADVCHTLQVGRRVFDCRQFAVVESPEDAARVLRGEDPERLVRGDGDDAERSVVFLFPGQGTQYAGMAQDLYAREPVFRREVDRCAEILEAELGLDLRTLLFPPAEEKEAASERLQETALTQPALFTVEYALARLWQSWGVEPEAMIGHSIGEYAAACLAGVFSLEDALAVVATRGRLMQEREPGSMLALTLPPEEVEELISAPEHAELSVSAVNGPRFVVVGGPTGAVEALQEQLTREERPGRMLHTSHAFHTSMMEPMLEPFRERLLRVEMRPPERPIRSNLTGDWLTAEEATDPEYWVSQVRRAVRFSDGLAGLLEELDAVFLEVGPGRTLVSFLKQQPGSRELGAGKLAGIPSLPHAKEQTSAQGFLLGALGKLWIAGVVIDWSGFYADERRLRTPLPTYPFERQRYWLTFARSGRAEQLGGDPDQERSDPADWFYLPSWKRSLPPALPATVAAEGDGTEAPRWLVFVDPCGVGDRVADRLAEHGVEVFRVEAGDGFERLDDRRWKIDPRAADHPGRLFEEVAEAGDAPIGVGWFWTVTPRELDAGWRQEDDLEVLGFRGLISLAQTWNRHLGSETVRLRVVSNDLHSVTGNEEIVPKKALAIGPCRVIPQEYPQIDCRNVDLALADWQGRHADRLVEHLTAELLTDEPRPRHEDFVAYRGGRRWLREIEPVRVSEPSEAAPRLRPEGVYLITGGLGGIGLEVADYLARSVRAKLVLTSRRQFPDNEEWAERVARNGDSKLGAQLRRLLELQEVGAEVMVVQADVADREAMARAFEEVHRRWGTIHGVVHSAGVPAGRMIQRDDPEATAAVLAPKVTGTLLLEELLEEHGDDLDFFVLCSSLASLIGGVGQADYCAANAFMDAFAHLRPRTVSVGWDRWTEVGMAYKAVHEKPEGQPAAAATSASAAATSAAETATPEPEAESMAIDHPILQRRVPGAGGEEIFVSTLRSEDHWVAHEHKINGEELLPGTTYFDLLAQAMAELGDAATGIELAEIGLLTPIVYPPGVAVEMRLVLTPEERAGGWSFEVRSAAATGGSGKGDGSRSWSRHAHGRLRWVGEIEERSNSLDQLRERCDLQRNAAPEGERIPDLNHGLRWQTVREVCAGRGEALIELALMDEIIEEAGDYTLHPALLDTALSSAPNVADVPDGTDPEELTAKKAAYLPLWYEQARILAPMPGRVFSHVVFRNQDEQMVTVDVDVMDADGRVVFEARGYHLRALGEEGIAAVPREQLALVEAQGGGGASKPEAVSAASATAAGEALDVGLTSEQGVEVFRRILARCEEPQVGVCTRDLAATYEMSSDPERVRRETEAEHAETAGERLARPALKTDYEAPRNDTEATIAEIWQELLGVDEIGIFDNFFDLGGHSVLGIQLVARVRQAFGREIPVNVIFERSTVESLADFIAGDDGGAADDAGAGSADPEVDTAAADLTDDELERAVEDMSPGEVDAMLEEMMDQGGAAS